MILRLKNYFNDYPIVFRIIIYILLIFQILHSACVSNQNQVDGVKNLNQSINKQDSSNLKLKNILLNLFSRNNIKGRDFFIKMDTLSIYDCICQSDLIKNKYTTIYVYLSKNRINKAGKSYYNFNFFTSLEFLSNRNNFSALVRLYNDTLYIDEGEKFVYFHNIYSLVTITTKDIKLIKEQPFLLFDQKKGNRWNIKQDLYLVDEIELLNKTIHEGEIFENFKFIDIDTDASHIPILKELWVSKKYGIIGIKYDSGTDDYNCWLK